MYTTLQTDNPQPHTDGYYTKDDDGKLISVLSFKTINDCMPMVDDIVEELIKQDRIGRIEFGDGLYEKCVFEDNVPFYEILSPPNNSYSNLYHLTKFWRKEKYGEGGREADPLTLVQAPHSYKEMFKKLVGDIERIHITRMQERIADVERTTQRDAAAYAAAEMTRQGGINDQSQSHHHLTLLVLIQEDVGRALRTP